VGVNSPHHGGKGGNKGVFARTEIKSRENPKGTLLGVNEHRGGGHKVNLVTDKGGKGLRGGGAWGKGRTRKTKRNFPRGGEGSVNQPAAKSQKKGAFIKVQGRTSSSLARERKRQGGKSGGGGEGETKNQKGGGTIIIP